MRLFFTRSLSAQALAQDVRALALPAGCDAIQVADALAGVPVGMAMPAMPFVLWDDGTYASEVNAFLRGLPLGYTADGVPTGRPTRSRESWKAIATDLVVFGSWLSDVRGVSLWEASVRDAHAYHEARRVVPSGIAGTPAVTAGTWNRNHTHLRRFYEYALASGLASVNPFGATGFGREVAVRSRKVRFVTLEIFDQWCEVGLRGEAEVLGWRMSQQATRNVVFAQFLLRTGVRLTEGSSLMASELPERVPSGSRGVVHLPGAITKGGVQRDLYLTAAGLHPLREWMEVERRTLVAGALDKNRYQRGFIVGRLDKSRVKFGDGTSTRIDQMIPETRRRLILADRDGDVQGPAALWVGSNGLPMSPASWHSVFRRANDRCAEAGLSIRITPHMLRHTFAVHMLSLLLAESMRPIREMLHSGADAHTVALRRLLIDPVRMLQLLLGHAHYTTTLDHYLPYIQQATEVSDAAIDRWQSVVGPRLQLVGGVER